MFHYSWKEGVRRNFRTGVSLHGHTWHSRENLAFLPAVIQKTYLFPTLTRWAERHYEKKWKAKFDYSLGYWTSPVSPEKAYALETDQIVSAGLSPLVSITDHDEIAACKDIVSLEWTAPYRGVRFHIGVHNLPHSAAPEVLEMLRHATAQPDDETALRAAFGELSGLKDTILVLNHPLVDQGQLGHEIHASLVREFLKNHRLSIHALEINALQPWKVNRRVIGIAKEASLPLIAGGDRHGFEPNGAINVTNAATFAEFAREIRHDKKSDILFMPQYREAIAFRYAKNVEVIMAGYPELGSRARWHDRIFYACPDGITRSFTELAGERSRMIRTTNRLVDAIGFVNRFTQPLAPVFLKSRWKKF